MTKDPKKSKKYFIAFEEKINGDCVPRAYGHSKDKVLKEMKKAQKKTKNVLHTYKYKKGRMVGLVA